MEIVQTLLRDDIESGELHPLQTASYELQFSLLYDPEVIGPMSIFKVEHRCCEARALRNIAKGWVSRRVHWTRSLSGPSLAAVTVHVGSPLVQQAVPSIVFKVSLDNADVSRMRSVIGVLRELNLAARDGRPQTMRLSMLSQLLEAHCSES